MYIYHVGLTIEIYNMNYTGFSLFTYIASTAVGNLNSNKCNTITGHNDVFEHD